ncbi:hypothetical protein [uncultured Gimesia sp.]|uniref:hypothetical protein n=1 Tax=uncultured Gimesia sp. TaxID=1678688 RepID=UPI002617D4A1|nr:hypothetical protein [uncultured Gimesia sp.]
MAYFIFFAGIATSGLLFNRGAIVTCSILGIVVLMIFTDPISSSHEEAAFKDFVVPLIGATSGAIIGLMIDWNLTHPTTIEPNPDDIQDDESNQITT